MFHLRPTSPQAGDRGCVPPARAGASVFVAAREDVLEPVPLRGEGLETDQQFGRVQVPDGVADLANEAVRRVQREVDEFRLGVAGPCPQGQGVCRGRFEVSPRFRRRETWRIRGVVRVEYDGGEDILLAVTADSDFLFSREACSSARGGPAIL